MLAKPSIRSTWPEGKVRQLAVLGATGSIGRSTLEVVRKHPQKFKVFGLAAGRNIELLSTQIAEFEPKMVSVEDDSAVAMLQERFPKVAIVSGRSGIRTLAVSPEVDTVVAAIVGMAGLDGVVAALNAGKVVALANKESLVAGGELVKRICQEKQGTLLPVDSEHSALFQVLQGSSLSEVRSLILTASGGPFLRLPRSEFPKVSPDQALRHPRWSMGAKISIDSATLVNKALEVIEARWLFDIPEEKIDVLIHPQSIVHSLVEYCDGTQLAQLSVPDMQGPIAYALSYPYDRLPQIMRPLRLAEVGKLEFEEPDYARFPAISIARQCLQQGGTAPAIFNLANEAAVSAFLTRRIGFERIVEFCQICLEKIPSTPYQNIEDLENLKTRVAEVAEML